MVADSNLESLYSKLPNIKLILNTILNYNNFDGIKSLLILAVVSVGIYCLIAFFVSKIYVKRVISLTTLKSQIVKSDAAKELKENSILWSYLI